MKDMKGYPYEQQMHEREHGETSLSEGISVFLMVTDVRHAATAWLRQQWVAVNSFIWEMP